MSFRFKTGQIVFQSARKSCGDLKPVPFVVLDRQSLEDESGTIFRYQCRSTENPDTVCVFRDWELEEWTEFPGS